MLVLAFDTATERGTAAVMLFDEHGRSTRLAGSTGPLDARHGETLLGLIEGVCAAAGVAPAALGLVAVGLGPGSFTGVRVGVATAKGLGLALGVPVRAVSTLAVLAGGCAAPDVIAVIEAKKGEVFAARYRGGAEVLAPIVGPTAEVARRLAEALGGERPLLVGRGADAPELAQLGPRGAPAGDLPCAEVLAALAHAAWRAEGPSDLSSLAPRYVRGADVTTPSGHGQAG